MLCIYYRRVCCFVLNGFFVPTQQCCLCVYKQIKSCPPIWSAGVQAMLYTFSANPQILRIPSGGSVHNILLSITMLASITSEWSMRTMKLPAVLISNFSMHILRQVVMVSLLQISCYTCFFPNSRLFLVLLPIFTCRLWSSTCFSRTQNCPPWWTVRLLIHLCLD